MVADWSGRVLVDATNRLASYAPATLGDISGRTSSEIVADLAPGAKVVKAFNTVPMSWIADVSPSKPQTGLFISGDHADAKQQVGAVIDQIGFCSIDLGSLATGGRLQQLGGSLAGVKLSSVKGSAYESARLQESAQSCRLLDPPCRRERAELRENDLLTDVRAIGVNRDEAAIRSLRSAEPGSCG